MTKKNKTIRGVRKNLASFLLAVGMLGMIGCSEGDKRIKASDYFSTEELAQDSIEVAGPEILDHYALDGSRVISWNHPNGTFLFYRDIDNDGWADTYGDGVSWMGVSRISSEDSVNSETYSMDNLAKKFVPRNKVTLW